MSHVQPSYVVTRDGVLIAFCQGRLRGGRDDDPKVILTSRSSDWGATWSPARAVSGRITHYAVSAYLSERDGRERVSVLSMVDLRGTENIYDKDYDEMRAQSGIDIDAVGRDTPMVLCRFDSDDDGDTWTMETLLGDRSPLNHRYSDGTLIMFNAVGQVHAITQGPYRGRYVLGGPVTVVPEGEAVTNYFRNHPQSGSAVIYSDDQGETWRVDGFITDYLANEASAVSINRGEELLLIRRLNSRGMLKAPHPSRGGASRFCAAHCPYFDGLWQDVVPALSRRYQWGALPRHACQGWEAFALFYSQWLRPARIRAAARYRAAARCDLFSDDEGQTWCHKVIEPETFSYSTVGPLNESQYITLYACSSMGQEGVGCRVFEDGVAGCLEGL